jgi:hypothetical protein
MIFGLRRAARATAPGLALCERVAASPTAPHHIRQLTERGMFKGGGADTPALCGAAVSWDTSSVTLDEIPRIVANSHPSYHLCVACVAAATG